MSDTGRKNLSDQVSDKVTPDSQKSTLDQTKDSASGLYDRAAGAIQPESQKSTSQKMADSTRSGKDDASNEGQSILASAQETVANAAQGISDTLQGKK
ncbi:hypothetical protein M501DRAFT_1003200 [Patellaria atrata CBS 101060]|uniref:Chaperone/heat shock protein Hsp12 n=1 Tax=Patellaria atrata CBS 101060 TaxID=1346257 RepID=A0A9P4SC46_9PEZI|nr:hypothetical protein M501DRAFT_1003200 [Patellaria atrata CBS 101060]